MLVGPAGRGKSALLVNWIQHLTKSRYIGDRPGQWHLAFVPISIRFDTNRPEVFYEALAARIAEIAGAEMSSAQTDATAYYEDQCRILLGRVLDEGKRILIVADGADEALGDRFNARWFPRNGGGSLRLLVSARLLLGDAGAAGWVRRLGWSDSVRYTALELMPLERPAVQDLLVTTGAPLDVLAARPEVVDKIYRLSEGEPLVLRMYVEDLWLRGEGTRALKLEDLDRIRPGLSGYFFDWMDRQRDSWRSNRKDGDEIDEATVTAYLMILACAHGPLSAEDIRELAKRVGVAERGMRVQDALQPLRRFVIGVGRAASESSGGYVLSHPKFGVFLQEDYLDADQVSSSRRAFAEWGSDLLDRLHDNTLRPEQVPSYALQYLSEHFVETGAPPSQFIKFASAGWLRAWQAREGGYRGFSRDIMRISQALSDQSDAATPYFSAQLRCALVVSSIASVVSKIPQQLMIFAVQHKLLPLRQALHWLEFQPSETRADVIVALAPGMTESDVDAALESVRSISDEADRATGLVALSNRMGGSDRDAIAPEIIQALAYPHLSLLGGQLGRRVGTLIAEYARNMPRKIVTEALGIARRINYGEGRARALIALALELQEPLRAECLREALTALSYVTGASQLFQELLEAVGPALAGPFLVDVVEAVSRFAPDARAGCFECLMQRLPSPLALLAIEAAQRIEYHARRQDTLGALIRHVPADVRDLAVFTSLGLARNSGDYIDTLTQIACGIQGPAIDVVLQHARLMLDDAAFVRAIGALSNQMTSREADAAVRRLPTMLDGMIGHGIALLSARVSDAVIAELWQEAAKLRHPPARAEAVAALIPRLSLQLRRGAVPVVGTLLDPLERMSAFIAVARALPDTECLEVWHEALRCIAADQFATERLAMIARCARDLPRELVLELLPEAAALRDDSHFVSALARIEGRLRGAADFVSHRDRSDRLASLLPVLLNRADKISRSLPRSYQGHRERALCSIVQLCPAKMLAETLDICSLCEDPWLLAAVASRADSPDRHALWQRALQAAARSDFSMWVSGWLRNVASSVPDHLIGDALTLARRIGDDTIQCRVLASFGRRLPLAVRDAELAEFLELLGRTTDQYDWSRADALRSVIPVLPAGLLVTAMAIALRIRSAAAVADCLEAAADDHGMLAEALDGGEPPPGILAELKPGLTGIVLDRVVAAARMLRRPVDRVGCLIVLGALLPEEGRQALCSEAADIASLIEDGFGRARALTELASHVPPDTAAALLRIALRAGRSIGDDPHQFHALSSILRLLPGTARERFAPELRRRLGTLKAGAARSALVVALFECTPAHDRDALVMDELALVIGVDDESVLASALVGLAPMLSDEQCMIAWRTAAAMRDAGERAKAIEALISRLPMEELVSTFRDQSRSNLWVPGQLLCSLAERLPVELVPELIARGREYAARRQVADMLIAAAGRLPPHERPLLLREAIDIAREYGLQLTLAQALTASVACRTEDQRNSVLREALDAVMSIGSQFGVQRMQALVKLVPVLPMTMYGAVLSDVSWVAADDDCYAAALGALRSLLPDDVLTGLINSSQDQPNRFVLAAAATAAAARPQLLDKAIVLAETQLAPRARCRALAAIVPHLDATLQKSVMASFVSSAAHLERRDLLPLIQSLLPVVAGCEGSDGISDVAQGILDVGDWFQ